MAKKKLSKPMKNTLFDLKKGREVYLFFQVKRSRSDIPNIHLTVKGSELRTLKALKSRGLIKYDMPSEKQTHCPVKLTQKGKNLDLNED